MSRRLWWLYGEGERKRGCKITKVVSPRLDAFHFMVSLRFGFVWVGLVDALEACKTGANGTANCVSGFLFSLPLLTRLFGVSVHSHTECGSLLAGHGR